MTLNFTFSNSGTSRFVQVIGSNARKFLVGDAKLSNKKYKVSKNDFV